MARVRTHIKKNKPSKNARERRKTFWRICQLEEEEQRLKVREAKYNRDVFWRNAWAVEWEKVQEELKEVKQKKERAVENTKCLVQNLKDKDDEMVRIMSKSEEIWVASVREKWEEKKTEYEKVINGLIREREGVEVELKGAREIIDSLEKRVGRLESRLERITHESLNKSFATFSL